MNLDSLGFYLIGMFCLIVLGEIRNVLKTISQRLIWINQDIQKIVTREDEQ